MGVPKFFQGFFLNPKIGCISTLFKFIGIRYRPTNFRKTAYPKSMRL